MSVYAFALAPRFLRATKISISQFSLLSGWMRRRNAQLRLRKLAMRKPLRSYEFKFCRMRQCSTFGWSKLDYFIGRIDSTRGTALPHLPQETKFQKSHEPNPFCSVRSHCFGICNDFAEPSRREHAFYFFKLCSSRAHTRLRRCFEQLPRRFQQTGAHCRATGCARKGGGSARAIWRERKGSRSTTSNNFGCCHARFSSGLANNTPQAPHSRLR
jgi:hypothetical protein